MGFCHGFATVGAVLASFWQAGRIANLGSGLESRELHMSGRSAAW
jgi:hypothetical protein